MNEDSVKLLKEVNSGCKNATDSFGQVRELVKDETLLALIDDYSQKHAEIGDQCHQMLNDQGEDEKDPPSVAKAVMRFTTEVKMMVDGDDSHAADLLQYGNKIPEQVYSPVQRSRSAGAFSGQSAHRIGI